MNKIDSNNKKIYFIFIFLLAILMFFVVFIPMRNQLKKQAIENYELLAGSKVHNTVEVINNCILNARSVSSRTAIRDYIIDYNKGGMSWIELQERTFSKYSDGVKVIHNLKIAIRYVSDKPLVVYGDEDVDKAYYEGVFEDSAQIEYSFIRNENKTEIIIYSPVMNGNVLIGKDIIVVDITEQMSELSGDGLTVAILHNSSYPVNGMREGEIYERYPIDSLNYMCFKRTVNPEFSILTKKPTHDVFQGVNRVLTISTVGFALGLVLIFIVLKMSLVKMANSMISEIGSDRDTYMKYANHDFLTGAYTRVFLDNWIKDKSKIESGSGSGREYVVVMIDVDHFKYINDVFGHETGDAVLKFISSTLMKLLREDDIVIRFGGDEFIVILEGITNGNVHKIFDRINQSIKDANNFEFDIMISFGIVEADSLDNIYDSIKKADEKMYRNKKIK